MHFFHNRFILLSVLTAIYASSNAQQRLSSPNSRKSVYAELLGNGPLLSVNYDCRFDGQRHGGPGYRLGLGVGRGLSATVPIGFNYLAGDRRNALETGFGITPEINFKQQNDVSTINGYAFLNIGYRLQPFREGMLFRFTYSPGISLAGEFAPVWFGASLGYTFK